MNEIQKLKDEIKRLEEDKKFLQLGRKIKSRVKNFVRITTTWDELKDGITYHHVEEVYNEGENSKAMEKNHDHRGVDSGDEYSLMLGVERFEAGKEYAKQHILSVYTSEMEQQLEAMEKGEAVGTQNAFFVGIVNYLRQIAIEWIVGTLTQLLKENAVKLADWLLGKLDDKIIEGYKKINEEDKSLLKNELKQHPRFSKLLERIEAFE